VWGGQVHYYGHYDALVSAEDKDSLGILDGIKLFCRSSTQLINNIDINKMLLFSFTVCSPLQISTRIDYHQISILEYMYVSIKLLM
jgi:hypothetical protein